jgi:hypothetical protein
LSGGDREHRKYADKELHHTSHPDQQLARSNGILVIRKMFLSPHQIAAPRMSSCDTLPASRDVGLCAAVGSIAEVKRALIKARPKAV